MFGAQYNECWSTLSTEKTVCNTRSAHLKNVLSLLEVEFVIRTPKVYFMAYDNFGLHGIAAEPSHPAMERVCLGPLLCAGYQVKLRRGKNEISLHDMTV